MKECVCCLQFVFMSVVCGKLCRAIYNLLDITVTDPGYALLNDDATYTRSLVFAGGSICLCASSAKVADLKCCKHDLDDWHVYIGKSATLHPPAYLEFSKRLLL